MEERLIVRTLGAFTVMREGRTISDSSARSYKVWKIFKYLVTNRHKMLSTEALIDIIWPDEQPANPLKSLHAIMFRLRKLLDRNGDVMRFGDVREAQRFLEGHGITDFSGYWFEREMDHVAE